jgi:hypothetical protein
MGRYGLLHCPYMRQSAALNDAFVFFGDFHSLGFEGALSANGPARRDDLLSRGLVRYDLGGRDDLGDRGWLANRPIVPAQLLCPHLRPLAVAHAVRVAEQMGV